MYRLFLTGNGRSKMIGEFETKQEAMGTLGNHNVLYHEEDEDHPGCWDIILKNGEIYSIECSY